MLPGEPLNSPALSRSNAVVRLRRHVLDTENLEAGCLQRTDRGLTPGAGALHEDLDLLQPVLHALARARVGGHLRGERGRLARALEPGRAGGLPRDHVSVLVGQRDDRVVERRLDVRLSDRDVLADAATRAAPGRCFARRRHLGFRRRLLAAAHWLGRALARTRIRAGALSVDGKTAPMADAAVRADLAEALDRLRAVAAQVTFHLELVVDVLTKLRDLLVGEVLDLRVGIEAERERNLARRRLADAVDVRQPDLEPLLVRKIYSGDACQTINPAFD